MWRASAPSNIALIKYMGKINGQNAVNSSVSWSLDHLRSTVEIELIGGGQDEWMPLETTVNFQLSEKGAEKFLKHFHRLKKIFQLEDRYFLIRSGNNFPADCGIASSASSFAALTLASVTAFCDLQKKPLPTQEAMALWSREGSGSSCRSLFSGWVAWDGDHVYQIPSPLKQILHQVFIVSGEKKQVSSSEAHKKVQSSALMVGRAERAQVRFQAIKAELEQDPLSWAQLYQLSWSDFWDMHALFETSEPPFGYMTAGSLQVTHCAREVWQQDGDGPIVTMDAGPNVHLLWRTEQREQALTFQKKFAMYECFHNLETV